ncbi:protein of unknown function (plasmid) [Thauera humireducens]|nr:protein of unknown function [Thauera humireducens]
MDCTCDPEPVGFAVESERGRGAEREHHCEQERSPPTW